MNFRDRLTHATAPHHARRSLPPPPATVAEARREAAAARTKIDALLAGFPGPTEREVNMALAEVVEGWSRGHLTRAQFIQAKALLVYADLLDRQVRGADGTKDAAADGREPAVVRPARSRAASSRRRRWFGRSPRRGGRADAWAAGSDGTQAAVSVRVGGFSVPFGETDR